MARFLVRVKDNLRAGHPNPDMAYRPGDIVSIIPDGADPGRKVIPPDWAVVDVPGVSVRNAERYIQSQFQSVEMPDGPENMAILRRLYKFDRELLTIEEKANFDSGTLSIAVRKYLETTVDKTTSQTEWDNGRRNI